MQENQHNLCQLFAQLGLPSSPGAVETFLAAHRPLDHGLTLHEAPFWSPAQKEFLSQQLIEDADWAVVVDELNLRLR